MKRVECLSVYRTTIMRIGTGTPQDPVRRVTQYWAMDGCTLLAEDDEFERHRVCDLENEIALLRARLEQVH